MLRLHPIIYEPLLRISGEYRVEPALVAAIIAVESNFDPLAPGDDGHSIGLMQLHDEGAGFGMSEDERRDPYLNIRRGVDYLCRNYWVLGNWRMAISAYNQGLKGLMDKGMSVNSAYIAAVVAHWTRYQESGVGPLEEPLWREDQ